MSDKKYISNSYIQEKLAIINRMGASLNALAEELKTDNVQYYCEYEKRKLIECCVAILKELGEEIN